MVAFCIRYFFIPLCRNLLKGIKGKYLQIIYIMIKFETVIYEYELLFNNTH